MWLSPKNKLPEDYTPVLLSCISQFQGVRYHTGYYDLLRKSWFIYLPIGIDKPDLKIDILETQLNVLLWSPIQPIITASEIL